VNTGNKDELPLQTVRFHKDISNGRLRTLVGDAEVVRINRGAWHCFFEIRSSQKAVDLEKKIEKWLEDSKDEQNAKREREFDVIYAKRKEQVKKNPQYLPASQVIFGGQRVEGYMFIDDTGQWQYVFPTQKDG